MKAAAWVTWTARRLGETRRGTRGVTGRRGPGDRVPESKLAGQNSEGLRAAWARISTTARSWGLTHSDIYVASNGHGPSRSGRPAGTGPPAAAPSGGDRNGARALGRGRLARLFPLNSERRTDNSRLRLVAQAISFLSEPARLHGARSDQVPSVCTVAPSSCSGDKMFRGLDIWPAAAEVEQLA